LRVLSNELRLRELVELLGAPSSAYDIGDPVSARTSATRKASMWSIEADVDRERPLDEHIEPLVAFAELHRAELGELRPQCKLIDISCGIFADEAEGGWELSPLLMRRLADVELPLACFLYSIAEPASE
jgi:hypothetical protein